MPLRTIPPYNINGPAGRVHGPPFFTSNIIINSGFVPPSLSDLVLWLKPETLSGLSNNTPVDIWPDSSGNSNDFISENSSFRPIYSVDQIGGQPAVVFDGTDDFLSKNSSLGVTSSFTVLVVFSFRTFAPGLGREFIFKNGEGSGYGIAKWDGKKVIFYSTGTFLIGDDCTVNNELWSIVRTSVPLARFFVNGIEISITNNNAAMPNPDANSRLGTFLNATNPLVGRVSEIMVWKINLTDGNRGLSENYLKLKYAIA